MRQQTKHDLRCTCSRQPLLAVYGLDDKNRLYLHIKVYKNRRIYGEILIHAGSKAELRCRECLRWYKLSIHGNKPTLVEAPEPEAIEEGITDHV